MALFLDALPRQPQQRVLGIGAGDGVLTEVLAPRFDLVVAYEVDPAMAQRARERIKAHEHVTVVAADFLQAEPPQRRFHVAGNVPFAITARVVDWCLNARTLATATLITQLESARKRSGDYRRWTPLTVETWPWVEWRLHGRISREAFRPVPAVDTAVMILLRRRTPRLPDTSREAWLHMVATGSRGVGGSLHASLRRSYTRRVDAAFASAELDRATVVAFVTPEQWLRIFPTLTPT